MPKLEKITREKFKFDFPPIKEIGQKTSLLFVNTDSAIDLPEPLQPNMIQIGGLQIVDSKPLPEVILVLKYKSKKSKLKLFFQGYGELRKEWKEGNNSDVTRNECEIQYAWQRSA